MNYISAKGCLAIVFPLVFLVTGCVGLAASVPHTNEVYKATNVDKDFSNYVPRQALPDETVERNTDKQTITYTKDQAGCYQHIVIIPMWIGNCQNKETWVFDNLNNVSVISTSYRMWGFWCSPIPYFVVIPSFQTGARGTIFFCDVHIGSRMREHSL